MTTINLFPHGLRPWQKEFIENQKRFTHLSVHRRAGKSYLAVARLLLTLVTIQRKGMLERPPEVHFLAPEKAQAVSIASDHVASLIAGIPGARMGKDNAIVHVPLPQAKLANGSPVIGKLRMEGLKDINRLRGSHSDGIWADEAAFYSNAEVISGVLIPMLDDFKGYLVLCSTVKGMNYFYDYKKAYESLIQQGSKLHSVFDFNVRQTGLKPPEEIDIEERAAKAVGNDNYNIWLREYMNDYSAGVSGALISAAEWENALGREPVNHTQYQRYMGVDLGFSNKGDPTVIYVRQGNKHFEHTEIQTGDSDVILSKINELILQYSPDRVFIDAAHGGTVIKQELKKMTYTPITPVFFQQEPDNPDMYLNKRAEMFHRMATHFKESGQIPQGNTKLREELLALEIDEDDKGRLKLASKKNVRSLIGRSTDVADACALTFAVQDTQSTSPSTSSTPSTPRSVDYYSKKLFDRMEREW